MKTTEPNFRQWAEVILEAQRANLHFSAEEYLAEELSKAYANGYQLGLNKGWALEQDEILREADEQLREYDRAISGATKFMQLDDFLGSEDLYDDDY